MDSASPCYDWRRAVFHGSISIESFVHLIIWLQLFREELERVVGDSLRDSGSDSIAGLISDVMNIKTGSKSSPTISLSPLLSLMIPTLLADTPTRIKLHSLEFLEHLLPRAKCKNQLRK